MNRIIRKFASFLTAAIVAAAAVFTVPTVNADALSKMKHKTEYTANSVKVTLTAKESGSKIYYTTDGSVPDSGSKLYKSRLTAKKAFVLRAVEIDKSGKKVSSIKMTVTPKIAKPVMSITGRGSTQFLKIRTSTNGAVIRYTTDGSAPNENSEIYTSPVPIEEGSVVTARAYKKGWTTSNTASYLHDTKEDEDPVEGVFKLVNEARAEAGLPALKLDKTLCEAAEVRVREITRKYDHMRPDGGDCFSVYKEFGIGFNYTGENIAAGNRTPESVMTAWMKSEGHRDNILGSHFSKIGIAHTEVNGYDYWVQMFIG